jgi:hypothetical protein
MAVHRALLLLSKHAILCNLTVAQLLHSISLTTCLRRDISLPQPISLDSSQAPNFLPPAISDFVAESIGIGGDVMQDLWYIIKDDVWEAPTEAEASVINEDCFRKYGWKRELSMSEQGLLLVYVTITSPPSFHIIVSTKYAMHQPRLYANK